MAGALQGHPGLTPGRGRGCHPAANIPGLPSARNRGRIGKPTPRLFSLRMVRGDCFSREGGHGSGRGLAPARAAPGTEGGSETTRGGFPAGWSGDCFSPEQCYGSGAPADAPRPRPPPPPSRLAEKPPARRASSGAAAPCTRHRPATRIPAAGWRTPDAPTIPATVPPAAEAAAETGPAPQPRGKASRRTATICASPKNPPPVTFRPQPCHRVRQHA